MIEGYVIGFLLILLVILFTLYFAARRYIGIVEEGIKAIAEREIKALGALRKCHDELNAGASEDWKKL